MAAVEWPDLSGCAARVLLRDDEGHPKAILLENADGAQGAEIARCLGEQDNGKAAKLLELGNSIGDELKMSGFATGTNMGDHYATVLPSRLGFDMLDPHFDQQYARHLDMKPYFEKARSRCKALLHGEEETLFFAKAGKQIAKARKQFWFSHLETRVQKYDAEKGDSAIYGFQHGRGDISWKDGGKLHPHTDAEHTGLVMLTSLGATCEFLVDLAKGEKSCELQQRGRCWCSDGKHWISKEVYSKQQDSRNKWQHHEAISCPKELCRKQACGTCQVVHMKSGDVLIFDAVDVVHGLQRVRQTTLIPNMPAWVSTHARYGLQMRWQDPQLQAQTFEAFVLNAWKNYCKHGSECQVVLALASKYPACKDFLETHKWDAFSKGPGGNAKGFLDTLVDEAKKCEGGRLIQGKCKSGKDGLHDLLFLRLPPSPPPCHQGCAFLSQKLSNDGRPSLFEGIRPSEGVSGGVTLAGYTLGGGRAGGCGGGGYVSNSAAADDVELQRVEAEIVQQVLLQSMQRSKCISGCGRFAARGHNTCCRMCAIGGPCTCGGEGEPADSDGPIICDIDSDDEAACSKSSTAKRSMPAGAADASAHDIIDLTGQSERKKKARA